MIGVYKLRKSWNLELDIELEFELDLLINMYLFFWAKVYTLLELY